MALDEPKESDNVYENDSIKFLVDKELLTTCGEIKVDFVDAGVRSGFGITSTNPLGNGGCSSGSCGDGSCSM